MLGIVNVLPSFYLMRCIDELTLTTTLQRIMIVIYFEAVLFGISIYTEKRAKYLIKKHGLLIGILIIEVCLCNIRWGIHMLPERYLENIVHVSVGENQNPEAQGQEVWLTGIWLDEKKQELSEFINSSESWMLNENALVATGEQPEILELTLAEADTIQLEFLKHPWSGIAEISCNGEAQTLDLYSAESTVQRLTLKGNVMPFETLERTVLLLGQTILSVLVLIWIGEFLTRRELEI